MNFVDFTIYNKRRKSVVKLNNVFYKFFDLRIFVLYKFKTDAVLVLGPLLIGVDMKKMTMAVCFAAVVSAFAQGGMGGGFGGPQSGGGKIEYSEKFADLNYVGDGKVYHTLDIYLPKETQESYPVVVHTYGSAWSMNNSKGSADINTICAALLKAGYAVVTPNHRSASDAIYPAQLHDLKAVVRFLRGNAAKYKIDTSFIAMSGFSSGGHLSSLVATTCGLKEGKSGSVTVDLVGDLGEFTSFSSCIDAATLWSPPTNIYTMNPINNFMGSGTYEGAFIGAEREGNKDKWMVASSPYYASDDDPPVILFHGTSDQIVNKEQSQELYDSLKNHNVVTELVSVQGGSHGGNEMYVDANLQKMVKFFDTAREAKAAKVPENTPRDSDEVSLPQIAKSYGMELHKNRLLVPAEKGTFHYTIFTVNGSHRVSGYFKKELDLSSLPKGVYGIVVQPSWGAKTIIRFVR
jgi:acetyl esterase/lipase